MEALICPSISHRGLLKIYLTIPNRTKSLNTSKQEYKLHSKWCAKKDEGKKETIYTIYTLL
jgi:hypothetical protein